MIDRKDYLALLDKRKEGEAKVQAFNKELLKQSAVKSQYLTNNEHWDDYLSRLQAKLDEAQVERLGWMEKSACALTEVDVKVAQLNFAIFNERVRCLEECMSLPQTLISANKG